MDLALSGGHRRLPCVCLQPLHVAHRESPRRCNNIPDVGPSTSSNHYSIIIISDTLTMFISRGTTQGSYSDHY